MPTLILIDGPLTSETLSWPEVPPTVQLRVPDRTTSCNCNPKLEDVVQESEIVQYHCVARGDKVGIYSVTTKEEAMLHALKAWITTDLTRPWHRSCRDRRAFR